jgi:hypothetical protein
MAVDLDKPIKRDHTANVKNHGIRRLAPTSVYFNGIPSSIYRNKIFNQIENILLYLEQFLLNILYDIMTLVYQYHGSYYTILNGTVHEKKKISQ